MPPAAGMRFSRFELVSRLGSGGSAFRDCLRRDMGQRV